MPTKREREYYRMGYEDGVDAMGGRPIRPTQVSASQAVTESYYRGELPKVSGFPRKKKRKLSAWNKYVKANSNKPRFRLRSGKINLKKMGVAFRKTPAGKKKRR